MIALGVALNSEAVPPDLEPPGILEIEPAEGAVVIELRSVRVVFSEAVTGVDAADLWVNGVSPTDVTVISPREYQFSFPAPPTGTVFITFVDAHGITDLAPMPNPFRNFGWSVEVDPARFVGHPVISEFMASNQNSIEDDDGEHSDWIEIYNPSLVAVNLRGWFLTDDPFNRVKWRMPDYVLAPNRYLLVFASGKDRVSASGWLHANFRLGVAGEYLALVRPDGLTVEFEYAGYPAQVDDRSYGMDRLNGAVRGYFDTATPGSANAVSGPGFVDPPRFSLESGVYTDEQILVTIYTVPGAAIRYTTDGSAPTNAASGQAYTGPINIVGNTVLKARAFREGLWPSAVEARSFLMLDGTTRGFSSSLPIVVIDTSGAIPASVIAGGARRRGSLTVFGNDCGRADLVGPAQFQGLAQFETFGQTSEGFPKKPHNVEINDEYAQDRPVSLLGMPPAADWKLISPYSDKPLLTQYLAFELFEQMGHYQPRRRLVEVFLNATPNTKLNYTNNYYGVMILVEKIERGADRVNIPELVSSETNEVAISGGYIFKRDKDSVGDVNFTTTSGTSLKMHEPKPRDLPGGTSHPQVQWLRRYLSLYEGAVNAPDWLTRTGTNHYSHYIDVNSFVDYHWIVEFTKNIDAYRLSNFFTKNRGGKIQNAPIWDWNLSFGNANYLEGGKTNGWYYPQLGNADHLFLRRLIGATTSGAPSGDPDFKQKIVDRWSVLRTNLLNGFRVAARIDELAVQLQEAARRNYARFDILKPSVSTWPNPNGPAGGWHVDYVNPTTYEGIIVEMKRWTVGRFQWIDSQFVGAPGVIDEGTNPVGRRVRLSSSGGEIYYTLDGSDPRQAGGGVSTRAMLYNESLVLPPEVQLTARVRRPTPAWEGTMWSGPVRYPETQPFSPLAITEVMYSPPAASRSSYARQDFEFIEVCNVSAEPLAVDRYTLEGGVRFLFPNAVLEPQQYAVIVRNQAAFLSRYGPGMMLLGEFGGALANDTDRLTLRDREGRVLLDFEYSGRWYPTTDGLGFSLCSMNPRALSETWGRREQWRPSAQVLGSPGFLNPEPAQVPAVLINEVLSNPEAPYEDAVELFNPSDLEADISGWFLSDDLGSPRKFQFPAGSVVPAGGYLALDEHAFNAAGSTTGFTLGGDGDDIYLFSTGANGELSGYAHGFSFGAAATNVSFGRHVTSIGEEYFVALTEVSLGRPNAGPRVGPIVISRIHYHPASLTPECAESSNNTLDEFIELRNISDAPAQLLEPDLLDGGWRIRDAVEFRIPWGTVLRPGGRVIVTSLDPNDGEALLAFRQRLGLSDDIPVLGPWEGALSNEGDNVELVRPGLVRGAAVEVVVDQVRYSDRAPWPVTADGLGAALQRIDEHGFGNDPLAWRGAEPFAANPGSNGAVIRVEPLNARVVAPIGGEVRLQVTVSGGPAARFQWFHNGRALPGANEASLLLNPITSRDAGTYQVLVYATNGGTAMATLHLSFGVGIEILQQPTDVAVHLPEVSTPLFTTNAVFSVGAGTVRPPLRYQWRFNGAELTGATSDLLVISNVSLAHEGTYVCALTDSIGTVLTAPARLTPLIRPRFLTVPSHQRVAAGALVSVSATVTGHPPSFTFEWRHGSTPIRNNVIAGYADFWTFNALTNLGTNSYRIVIKSAANPTPGIPSQFNVVTLADRDFDGLPDEYEADHGMDPGNRLDAALDPDGDGMTNAAEYVAGTDPNDPLSVLRIEAPTVAGGAASVSFLAASNRTYVVEARSTADAGPWQVLGEVVATATNRWVTVEDAGANPGTAAPGQRVYRVGTPRQ